MKKYILVICIAAAIAACNKKATPTTVKETGESPKTEIVIKTPPVDSSLKTAPVAGRINMALISSGQKIYEANCGKCHDLKKTTDFTQERWIGVMRWMAPKAKLTDDQHAQALAYVQFYAKDAPKDRSNM